jgi:predicted patatin/cPLA2 family phospholipase
MTGAPSSAAVREPPNFEAVVFAGGGCRCFWQAGFWEVAAPALQLRPRLVGAVSAGAAMACMLFGDAVADTLAYFQDRVAANRRNVYWTNALKRQPLFPHPQIYRDTILANLDARRLERLHAGPDIRVLVALVPDWLGPRSGFLLGLLAYQAETFLRPGPHASLGRQAGFVSHVASVRDCQTPEALADLILHSSCTPPITPVYRRGARPVLDGGLIDSAPLETIPAPAPPTLVLLTKPFPPECIPRVSGRVYAQPSQPVPVHKWDYTNPDGVRAAYDLGRRDGERFVDQVCRARSV